MVRSPLASRTDAALDHRGGRRVLEGDLLESHNALPRGEPANRVLPATRSGTFALIPEVTAELIVDDDLDEETMDGDGCIDIEIELVEDESPEVEQRARPAAATPAHVSQVHHHAIPPPARADAPTVGLPEFDTNERHPGVPEIHRNDRIGRPAARQLPRFSIDESPVEPLAQQPSWPVHQPRIQAPAEVCWMCPLYLSAAGMSAECQRARRAR